MTSLGAYTSGFNKEDGRCVKHISDRPSASLRKEVAGRARNLWQLPLNGCTR